MNNQSARALVYARVSTKKQDAMAQLIRCQEYCTQKAIPLKKPLKISLLGEGILWIALQCESF